jgi:hypothetical protein
MIHAGLMVAAGAVRLQGSGPPTLTAIPRDIYDEVFSYLDKKDGSNWSDGELETLTNMKIWRRKFFISVEVAKGIYAVFLSLKNKSDWPLYIGISSVLDEILNKSIRVK